MRIMTALVTLAALSCADSLWPSSWKDYVSSQDEVTTWASTVRGVIRGKTGMAVLQASPGDSYRFQPLLQSLATVEGVSDLILPVGGLGSGRREDVVDSYIQMIRYDNGKRWRRLIYEQTSAVASTFPDLNVYWQIGNEINSWHYGTTMSAKTDSDETLQRDPIEDIRLLQWDNADQRAQRKEERKKSRNQLKKINRNNPELIPVYVEYFLAPTAEAIMDARQNEADQAGRIRIVLGTLANSHNARAQTWLESLLNYRVRGDYAPQLAGRLVSEIVDIVALHYMVSSPGPDWRYALNRMYGAWLGTGSISGIWSTEEIGKKRGMSNRGGAAAISVLARYLSLWNELGANPSQGRVNFWGWDLGDDGARAADAMQTFMELVGDTQLTPLAAHEASLLSSENSESYFFETANDQLLMVQFSADQRRSPSLSSFRVRWECSSAPQITVVVFSDGGQSTPEHWHTLDDGWLTVNTSAGLSPRDAILVVVDRG